MLKVDSCFFMESGGARINLSRRHTPGDRSPASLWRINFSYRESWFANVKKHIRNTRPAIPILRNLFSYHGIR
jgi:hypothetical protein